MASIALIRKAREAGMELANNPHSNKTIADTIAVPN
jgi:hypothetical protein